MVFHGLDTEEMKSIATQAKVLLESAMSNVEVASRLLFNHCEKTDDLEELDKYLFHISTELQTAAKWASEMKEVR